MNLIKGDVVEIISADTLLIEVRFIGNFNSKGLPDLIKVRFSALSPPYTKGVAPEYIVETLNKTLLGVYVSANVSGPDLNGVYKGKVTREGAYFRRKKKFM